MHRNCTYYLLLQLVGGGCKDVKIAILFSMSFSGLMHGLYTCHRIWCKLRACVLKLLYLQFYWFYMKVQSTQIPFLQSIKLRWWVLVINFYVSCALPQEDVPFIYNSQYFTTKGCILYILPFVTTTIANHIRNNAIIRLN